MFIEGNIRGELNKQYDEQKPLYRCSTIEDAELDDLLCRLFHSDPKFVEKVIKTIFPKSYRQNNSMVIDDRLYISLNKFCCGKITHRSDFPSDNIRIIYFLQNNPDPHPHYWYDFVMRVVQEKGWLPEKVAKHIVQELGLQISPKQRYLFHNKPCYELALLNEYDLDLCRKIVAHSFPCVYGYTQVNSYWYKTENGNIKFGILYYYNKDLNKYYYLPISAWRQVLPIKKRRIEYDLIMPDGRLPLYNLDKLIKFNHPKYVLICQFEKNVEFITEKYSNELYDIPLISYFSKENSDWSPLLGCIPIIFADGGKDLIQQSYKLYSILEQNGLSPLFINSYKDVTIYDEKFKEEITKIQKGEGLCSLREYADHNLKEFGVEPPAGVSRTATRLSRKPAKRKTREVLIKDLFDLHETMTIYAKPGVGKSMFSLLLALSFVSGKSVLDDHVCPPHPYRVLLIDGELRKEDIHARGIELCKGHGLLEDAIYEIDILSVADGDISSNLESEIEQGKRNEDFKDADIIIIDSVFCFFPSAMDSEAQKTEPLRNFVQKWKQKRKTLIFIDHQGKTRTGALGSSTKEFLFDVIIHLEGNNNKIHIKVDKLRNHPQIIGSYITLKIQNSNEEEMIKFHVINSTTSTSLSLDNPIVPKEDKSNQSIQVLSKEDINIMISEYIKNNPEAKQKDIITALLPQVSCSDKTLARRIKKMYDNGELDFWENPPKGKKSSSDSKK